MTRSARFPRRKRHHAAALLAVCAATTSACFRLDRGIEQTLGSAAGRGVVVVDGARSPAAFSAVQSAGSAQRRNARADGNFVVTRLPAGPFTVRVLDDPDGDGWTNRAATVGAAMPVTVDGTAGFVLLGDVPLSGSFGLRGTAKAGPTDGGEPVVVDGDRVARVFALRGACTTSPDSDDVDVDIGTAACTGVEVAGRVEFGADGVAAVDGSGAWQLTAIPEGTVDVVALLYTRRADGTLGDVVDVDGPVTLTKSAEDNGDAVIADDGPAFVFRGAPLPPTTVQLSFSEPIEPLAVEAPVDPAPLALFSPAGAPVPGCARGRTSTAFVAELVVGSTAQTVRGLPVGVWNVAVCSGASRGTAVPGLVALPETGTPPLWAVTLRPDDPCPDVDDPDTVRADLAALAERDCDGDGLAGLPAARLVAYAAWCADACFPDGAVSVGAVCDVGGVDWDCDDDADGQADVTEPACIGPDRGTDLDGDAVCSVVDAFPHCAANDATACIAGVEDLAPRLAQGAGTVVAGPAFTGNVVDDPLLLDFAGEPWVVIQGVVDDDGRALDAVGVRVADLTVANLGPFSFSATDSGIARRGREAVLVGGRTTTDVDGVPRSTARAEVVRVALAQGPTTPAVRTLLTASLAQARHSTQATFVGERIVVLGGVVIDDAGVSTLTASIELVDPGNEVALPAGSLRQARAGAVVGTFTDNDGDHVFVAGGRSDPRLVNCLASAESFIVPAPGAGDALGVDDERVPDLGVPRCDHTLAVVPGTTPTFVVIGGRGDEAGGSLEVWRPGEPAWVRGTLGVPRHGHRSVVLPDGRIVVLGGFDPVTNEPVPVGEVVDLTGIASLDEVPGLPFLFTVPQGANEGGERALVLDDGRVFLVRDVAGAGLANTTEVLTLPP